MLAAIIGYPLGHSMSPAIHNAAYRAMGLDLTFEAWSTPPEDVPAAVARLREPEMLGMNVTVPHKQAVMPLLDEVDATARAIGAVNTIVKQDGRLVGYNTDRYGFIRSLREAGCDPAGKHVVILGYGGSERAVAYGLAEARRRLDLDRRAPPRRHRRGRRAARDDHAAPVSHRCAVQRRIIGHDLRPRRPDR